MNTDRILLIVEDDAALQKQMRWAFDAYSPVVASDADTAIAMVRKHTPAVVTMDLGLPPSPGDTTVGFALLTQILSLSPHTKVIVLTGQDDRANALEAIKRGAYDFYAKPFEPEFLGHTIERAFAVSGLEAENRKLQQQAVNQPLSGILTQDAAMLGVCKVVERVAATSATVLVLGESGTGKELVARGLHNLSPRRQEKFVAINCAAIPENLLESELFGYEKGAFTGAVKTTPGRIETAHKGTLFLDEIGDLPGALQAKLLRFLQERVIERIGGRSEIQVDVRIICATHRNIKEMIAQGNFREDLYFRLAQISIEVPPLRARPGDAILLARIFAHRFAELDQRKVLSIPPQTAAAIESYPWPGNVRQLENSMRRAVIMAQGNEIQVADLGLDSAVEAVPLNLREVRDTAEKQALSRALAHADGNMSKAAEMLGISRPTLYELLDRFSMR